VRFKLDENLPNDLAEALRQHHHDVHDVRAEGLAGSPDTAVLGAASTEERVFLTFDTDFADVRRYPPGSHAGIVVFRLHDQRWATLRDPIQRLLDGDAMAGLSGGLAIVEETRVRLRRRR